FVAHKDAPDPTPVPQDCTLIANLHPSCADTPNDVSLCRAYNLASLKDPNGNDGLNAAQIESRMIAQNQCIPVLERLVAQETACMGEADLNAPTNPLCEAIITRVCDGNIFNDAAGTGDTGFNCTEVTRYDDRRKQICRNPYYGSTISACGDIIVDICTNDNPFTQTTGRNPTNLCNSSYDDVRKTACESLVSRDTIAPQKCFNTIAQVCNDNPFDENFCYATHFDFTTKRVRLCHTNMDAGGMDPNNTPAGEAGVCNALIAASCPDEGVRNAGCPTPIPTPSTRFVAWADSLAVKPVSTIPETETQESRILLGGADGLDTVTNVDSIVAPESVFRLSPYSTEQAYKSGFAVFSANTTNFDKIGHYTGILFGTDVGAPLTDPTVDAQWGGTIAWVSGDGAFVKQDYNFILNVNFFTSTIGARHRVTDLWASLPGRENTDVISDLTAEWDTAGILTGTLELDRSGTISEGVLTGMIGDNGAVAVFTSKAGQPVAFAGGFTARPTNTPRVTPFVTASTWVSSFNISTGATTARNAQGYTLLAAGDFVKGAFSTTLNKSYFITGRANGLGLNAEDKEHNEREVPELILRLNDTEGSAGYTSGFAFFSGDIINDASEKNTRVDDTRQYYAGLLSGTTVGERLPYKVSYNSVASATWGGVISGRFGHHSSTELGDPPTNPQPGINIDKNDYVTDRNFQIEIDFVASTIKTPTGAGKGSFHGVDLRFDGSFDRNGIMSGNVSVARQSDTTIASIRRDHGPGTFTGIIGQDAAIGVFKANRGSTGDVNSGYIGGFIATPCNLDASDPTCKNNPSALTAFCTNTTANDGENPFHSECDNETGIDVPRTTVCLAGVIDTASESRCPGLLVIACVDATVNMGSNPWTDACSALATTAALDMTALDMARDTACLNFGAQADKLCRGRGIIQRSCTEADPYAYVGCNTAAHINDGHRQAYCMKDEGIKDPACPNATSGDWVASLTDLNTDPATATDSTPTNEFLQIADKTISTAETTTEANAGGEAPTPTTLDFSQITLATPSMALNTDDGLAYFNGYQGSTLYYYAGIFGSTDLGAPIDADITATWTAILSINGTEAIFDLDVVFDGADGMDNTVKGFITNPIDTNDLLIDGTFTANGVIEGKVHYAVFADETTPASPAPFNGSLSGLISTDGAVAVFIGAGYSGGFVAVPDTVSFGVWQGSFDGGFNDAQTLLASGASGTGAGFVNNSSRFIELTEDNKILLASIGARVDPTILRLNDTDGQKGYESGIGFFIAPSLNSKTSQYFGGLLPTTDLGAPLTDVSKNGTWTGTIAGITNDDALTNTELKLQVMFGDTFANGVGTIKSIATGTTALGAVNVETRPGAIPYMSTFNFDGGFNAQGVITGTVAHTNGKPIDGGTVNGVFNGLIGVDGAVGVFKSNDSQAFGFIGGFVANPPAE
nr:hypothetical protein [Pseudomonadota bacterium]